MWLIHFQGGSLRIIKVPQQQEVLTGLFTYTKASDGTFFLCGALRCKKDGAAIIIVPLCLLALDLCLNAPSNLLH